MHALNDHGTTVILGTLRRTVDWVEPVTVSGEGDWLLGEIAEMPGKD